MDESDDRTLNSPRFQVRRDAHGRPREWEGGFIRYRKNGDPVYVINQMIRGRRYHKALRVPSQRDALFEYLKFKQDPEGYISGEEDLDKAIFLTRELIDEYIAFCRKPKRENGKENGAKWLATKKAALLWWAERLVDERGNPLSLRRIRRARHILPHLDGVPADTPAEWKIPPASGARHKREAIKALYGWLRKHVGRISAAEDPVMDLPVGPGGVAQTEGGQNKVVPREHVLAVSEHLIAKGSRFGHALVVQAATGWHTTELVRFIAAGEIIQPVPRHLQEPGVVAVLVGPKHKNGKRHFAKVGDKAAFSARVLVTQEPEASHEPREFHRGMRGPAVSISERWYYVSVKRACKELGIPRFSPAWMRHTNATYALEQGGYTPEDVGKFLGHVDGSMVRSVYGPNAVPPKVPTIMDALHTATETPPTADLTALTAKLERLEAELADVRDGRGRGASGSHSNKAVVEQLEGVLRALKKDP